MGKDCPVERLIDGLRSRSEETPARACSALEEIGEPAVAPLIDALKDADRNVRSGAVCALGYIRDQRAVDPLIGALKDPDAQVRTSAAIALADLGSNRAVGPLIEALRDKDDCVRAFAASGLRVITGEDFGANPDSWQKWWEEVRPER